MVVKKVRAETPPELPAEFATPSELSFDAFLGSIPSEGDLRVSLRRLASDLHPHLAIPEDVYPAPRSGPFEDMKEETARRHGPGEYSLTVNYYGPGGRKDRKTKTVRFRIAARGESAQPEPEGTELIPGAGSHDRIDETLETARRSLEARAKLAELRALTTEGNGSSDTRMLELLAALKAMQPDMLTVLKNAKDFLAPAPGASADGIGSVGMLKEIFALVRELTPAGGEGAPVGFWSAAMPHIVDLLKAYAPYLPNIAQALLQVRNAAQDGGGAPTSGVIAKPEAPAAQAVALPEINLALVAQRFGGSPVISLAVRTFLDTAWLEAIRETHTPENDREAYQLLEGLADRSLPGLLDQISAATEDAAWIYWTQMDPRMGAAPAGREFLRGFLAYLNEADPPGQPAESNHADKA